MNCRFVVPKKVPAYSNEQASQLTLNALLSPGKESLPYKTFKYMTAINDQIAEAFVNRLKSDHNRMATIDAGLFCPLMDRVPMTRKLYEAYVFLAEYKNWDYTMSTDHVRNIKKSLEGFKLYWLSGCKGEVQREDIYLDGVCILGDKPGKMAASEDEIRDWLGKQIGKSLDTGKRIFVTETCAGVCCLGAEIVLRLKKKYSGIKLLLLSAYPYELENTDVGSFNSILRRFVYDKKATEESRLWEPRIIAIEKQADMMFYANKTKDGDSLILNHCSSMITVCSSSEYQSVIVDARGKDISISSYNP